MEDVLIYKRTMTEVKEIFKYLEPQILNNIPIKLRKEIEEFECEEYSFKIDKTKTLINQNISKETQKFISLIYLKYCCDPNEKAQLMKICKENNEKQLKYKSYEEIFEKKPQTTENMQLVVVEPKEIWYKKIWKKLKEIFKIKK